ncbi:MAG TPA: UMP kinase [Candidatus Paceibacterota bacterium]|nr:UMP kinase [Candidatus Paceibacterota bacterium]
MGEKKVIVMSLGGSLIVPDEVNLKIINEFKRVVDKHKKNYKFVVVCGGGSIARKYIHALRKSGKSEFLQSLAGIAVTRVNARFLTYFFGRDANEGIPQDMLQVKNLLKKNDIVFCGALRYSPDQTSDSTSAKLANFFNCDFVNLTLVSGLYTKNPLENKDAKFVPFISWKDFKKMIDKIDFKPGQHFVLDQTAAEIILKNNIKTYILGSDMRNLDNFLSGKKFIGTVIDN